MEQRVSFAGRPPPPWEAVRDVLTGAGFPAQLHMIDGELSLPDEAPPAAWRELRVGTPQGMVTLRREAGAVMCVTWGNADAPLRQAWNAVAWALARAGGGSIETQGGPRDADAFRREADLPEALRF
jgi:hypothetical protein